jgi:hypothetical protein
MPHSRWLIAALLVGLAGCNTWRGEPEGHGPQWIERPAIDMTDKLGQPDRKVRMPPPAQSVAWMYTAGAEPGFAICERIYFVRGPTVVGYSEHGTDPRCNRIAGRTDD